VWDENGASQAYIVSADLDLDSLSKVMKDAFPAESIEVHASEDRVLLTGYVGTEVSYDGGAKDGRAVFEGRLELAGDQ
jgi:Flp pilus assembly secretin CpaC